MRAVRTYFLVAILAVLSSGLKGQGREPLEGRNPDHSNFLCAKSGARIVAVSSPSPPPFRADNLINDSLGGDAFWRIANKAKFPHWVVIELPKKQMITTMRVATHSLSEKQFKGITASVLKVEFSTESAHTGYKQVAREFLMKNKEDHTFNVSADSARWIRLTIENNFDHPHFTEIGRVYAYNDFALNQYEMAFANEGKLEVHEIKFEEDSYQITQESIPLIETVASVIKNHPDWEVVVEGHTDSVGEGRYNQQLSEKRAQAVLEMLVDLGVEPDRLAAQGFGEALPLVEEELSEKDRAENRRVTFRVKNHSLFSQEEE